jgi:hypothetical protein
MVHPRNQSGSARFGRIIQRSRSRDILGIMKKPPVTRAVRIINRNNADDEVKGNNQAAISLGEPDDNGGRRRASAQPAVGLDPV